MLKIAERFFAVVTLVVTAPVALLWFAAPAIGGLFVGLPVAGIKFALTGKSGIDWYMDTVMEFVMMNWPPFLWLDSIKRRQNG